MNLIEPAGAALVLVDYQSRLMPAIHGGAAALGHALRLADIARVLGLPVLGTEQNPGGLGPNAQAIRERCDLSVQKMHFDACEDGLLNELGKYSATHIVIAGCEAHVCLLQTAFGLLRAGLTVSVVAQASGSRTAENHALAMRRLERAGADIVSVEMVAFEWLRSCEHRHFKAVLQLLKSAPA